MIPLSVLHPTPVKIDKTPADAQRDSCELAQHVDNWGYNRLWVTEHHNMTGVATPDRMSKGDLEWHAAGWEGTLITDRATPCDAVSNQRAKPNMQNSSSCD